MMKVRELIRLWDIKMLYSSGQKLVVQYEGAEILMYAYSDFGGAFVFKGARSYFAFLNGRRCHQVAKVVGLIKGASFDKSSTINKDLERYAFLQSV